jgi:putative ABC transport system substrate-binding protein
MRNVFSLIAIIVALVGLGTVAEAQQPKKVPRIGIVSATGDPSNPGLYVEGFRQGLRDLGYIEGKNILIEYRSAEGKSDRYPSLVPNSCNSRSMSLSPRLQERSAQPSRRPRRLPLSS